MYQWLCSTRRHVAVTGQGYGRFHFIEPPLTCVTFMTCYITFKLPFIPAFFGEHVCFISMISIILLGVFCALTFTGLITFFLEPNIFVIYLITLLIKPALGLRPEPFHSSLWLLSFSVPSKQAQVMQPNIQMNSWSGERKGHKSLLKGWSVEYNVREIALNVNW